MVKYRWRFERLYFESGEYGIGFDINTNEEWEDEREYFVVAYIGKLGFNFGKYHYREI